MDKKLHKIRKQTDENEIMKAITSRNGSGKDIYVCERTKDEQSDGLGSN